MRDIRRQLQEGEEILFVAAPSKISLLPLAIVTIVLLIATFTLWNAQDRQEPLVLIIGLLISAVPLLVLLQQLVILNSNRYVLTNHRVIRQSGVLTKSSVDSYLDKINNVEHKQTLWGRILGYGDVEIDTASETGMTTFRMIRNPLEFKNALVAAAEQYRRPGAAFASAPAGADRMRQLKQLLDEGLISQAEFDERRKKILEVL